MKYLRPAVVLGLLLISPLPGRAEAPSTPQGSLAAVMEGAGQALLYDRIQDAYVVVRIGDLFQGFQVEAIERNQLILASRTSPPMHFVLPKVSELIRIDDVAHPTQPRPAPKVTHLTPEDLAPIDPYAEQTLSILDPYANQSINSVVAPEASRASEPVPAPPPHTAGQPGDTASVAPPQPQVILAPATEIPAPETSSSAPTPTPIPTPAPASAKEPVQMLVRAQFNAALDDFHALSKEVKLVVDDQGVAIRELAAGTFLHQLGLRKGDRVLRVAGQRINNLDAAAMVYARLMAVDEFSVVVVREHRNLTLRYRFDR